MNDIHTEKGLKALQDPTSLLRLPFTNNAVRSTGELHWMQPPCFQVLAMRMGAGEEFTLPFSEASSADVFQKHFI